MRKLSNYILTACENSHYQNDDLQNYPYQRAHHCDAASQCLLVAQVNRCHP